MEREPQLREDSSTAQDPFLKKEKQLGATTKRGSKP